MFICVDYLMVIILFVFNDWSVNSENQFNIVLYIKIYTIKNVLLKKKSQGGSFYNIKLLSQNIAIKKKNTKNIDDFNLIQKKKPTGK
jgi:hypothetical protein